jgi:hypothetical protein
MKRARTSRKSTNWGRERERERERERIGVLIDIMGSRPNKCLCNLSINNFL